MRRKMHKGIRSGDGRGWVGCLLLLMVLVGSVGGHAAEGNVFSFGSNTYGQLGHGDTTDRYTPTEVPLLSNAIAVASGRHHSLVVLEGGAVYSFGHNHWGQLGHGDTAERRLPARIEGLPSIPAVAITAGDNHSIILLENGAVYSFGANAFGQLGHGDTTNRSTPTKITSLSDVVAIAAGGHHSLVVLGNGDVYSFGSNLSGQLGHGDTEHRHAPTKIVPLSDWVGVVAVAAGLNHSLVIMANGNIYSFGFNHWGQLGHGDTDDRHWPTRIDKLATVIDLYKTQCVAAAAGHGQSLVLLENGDVWVFGSNVYGELGLGDEPPYIISTPEILRSSVRSVAAGLKHSLLLSENGDVHSFGDNEYGQLGHGDTMPRSTPAKISTLSDAIAIAAAPYGYHCLVIGTGEPDLVVQSLTVQPSSSELGTELTTTIEIKNQGNAGVSQAFVTDFYEDLASRPNPGDWGDAWWELGSLAAGATHTFIHTFFPASAGTKQAWAQVDTDRNVSDSPHVLGPVVYVVEPGVELPDEFQVRRETGDVLSPGAFYGAGTHLGGADLAEWVQVSEPVEPGHVLEIDPTASNTYRLACGPCSASVAGLVSTAPGIVLGGDLVLSSEFEVLGEGQAMLALLGVVPVKVTDEGGPIAVGDLLIVSSTPGYAMRWDLDTGGFCGLVGKALEPHEQGEGMIEVLLTR